MGTSPLGEQEARRLSELFSESVHLLLSAGDQLSSVRYHLHLEVGAMHSGPGPPGPGTRPLLAPPQQFPSSTHSSLGAHSLPCTSPVTAAQVTAAFGGRHGNFFPFPFFFKFNFYCILE